MNARLYLPGQPPRQLSVEGLTLPDRESGYARITMREASILGCSGKLVDVLASGPNYVAYSIFDYEGGELNLPAMRILSEVSPTSFDEGDEDSFLFGPVLVVTSF